jgi:hypothetical protein
MNIKLKQKLTMRELMAAMKASHVRIEALMNVSLEKMEGKPESIVCGGA